MPLNTPTTYAATQPFARAIAELLDAASLQLGERGATTKSFPAPAVWSDFNYRHWSPAFTTAIAVTPGRKILTSDYGLQLTFEFEKRGQLFIRSYNEALSVAPVRVNNPDRSPLGIDG